MVRARALVVAIFVSAALAPAAKAGSVIPAPLPALQNARAGLHGLTNEAAAYRELGAATAAPLWVDPSDIVTPPAGRAVFADTRSALIELEPELASPAPPTAVTRAETLILAADRRLAERVITEAAGGAGLLERAHGMVLSGDRWAETADVDLAAEQYGAAWVDAFGALTPLVSTPTENVPATAFAAAAESALATDRISLKGVHAVQNQPPLTRGGKPELVLVAPDSCAACALDSWAVVEALSQFGTFANLHLSQSATTRRPIIRGFTFDGSGYGSPYLAFAIGAPSSKVPRPLPFVDIANRFADEGSPASERVSNGLSWRRLAGTLSRPNAPSGQTLDGTAELLTAEICAATGGAPATVCGAAAVQEYQNRLPPTTP